MRRVSRMPWTIAAAAALLTVVATSFVALTTRARDEARFENAVESTCDRIAARLGSYVTLLRGASSLTSAEDTVSLADFRTYVAGLEITLGSLISEQRREELLEAREQAEE
ncbi:MAG: hypothetical protein ACR2F9_09635 [Longimicrobiaceae bacterium]